MAKRIFLTLAVAAVLIISLGYFKTRQIQAAVQAHSFQPPPEAITTVVVKQQTEANVGEIRAAIDRKTIRAPCSGVLGIRQANLGQYLAAGSPIVPLQSLNPIYVNFSVPQQVIGQVKVGDNVQLTTENLAG